jgi:hypothetical protein
MPRGDNNKSGSAGRGGSNQSNQALGSTSNLGKSHHKQPTSGKPSQPDKKKMDQSAQRNQSTRKESK